MLSKLHVKIFGGIEATPLAKFLTLNVKHETCRFHMENVGISRSKFLRTFLRPSQTTMRVDDSYNLASVSANFHPLSLTLIDSHQL